jgi:hypothetical protein
LGDRREAITYLLNADSKGSSEAAYELAQTYAWAAREQGRKQQDGSQGGSAYMRNAYAAILGELRIRAPQDKDYGNTAEKYFLRAAHRGSDPALHDLAQGYSSGLFGRTDLTEARAWSALWAFGDSKEQTDRRNYRDNLLRGAKKNDLDAVCSRIRELTAADSAIPPVKPSLAERSQTDPLIIRCVSNQTSYGVNNSCLDQSLLESPDKR